MTEPSNIVSFPQFGTNDWIEGYHQVRLTKLDEATIDAYLRILRQFTEWVAKRPGHGKHFEPEQLTTTVVEGYLSLLKEQGYSVSHRTRVKSVIKHFCQWLIDEKDLLKRNPTTGIEIKAQQTLAPRVLSPDQRFVLRNLVEKADDLRGKALFAPGYWAGCRVSHEEWELVADLSFHDLRHDFAHRAREVGWSLEEVAYYLGHVTMKGTPAIQTTVRYTQVNRAHVKEKLKLLKG